MTVVGAVLTLIISAQRSGEEGAGGHRGEGRAVAEIVVTESLGSFRNIARFIFLVVAAVNEERPPH
jgi:hypothetical protein